jgi:hypothetical protein
MDAFVAIFVVLGLLLGLLGLYLLPAILGTSRHVANVEVLWLVNILLGWTVIGWLVCVLWAATGRTAEEDAYWRKKVANGD